MSAANEAAAAEEAARALPRWLAPAAAFDVLALLLAALGGVLTPAHWTTLWGDREFSAWVAPIANRLGGGARLYEWGLHSPMPPLPTLLMHALYPGGALWIDESRLNYLCQALTLLVLFTALVGRLGTGVAFATIAAALPIFLALPKTIVYDSMAQLLVAVMGVVTVRLAARSGRAPQGGPRAVLEPLAEVLGLGLAGALLMLTKQSTGAGALLGVCAVLAILPGDAPRASRLRAVAAALAATWGMLVAASLALPAVNLRGMLEDLFLYGSETKGGAGWLVRLLTFVFEMGLLVLGVVLAWRMLLLLVAWLRGPDARPLRVEVSADAAPDGSAAATGPLLVAGTLASLAGWMIADPALSPRPEWLDPAWKLFKYASASLLVVGLAWSLAAQGALLLERAPMWPRLRRPHLAGHPLAALGLVFLPAALFHNLSVPMLRWTYDNNPLIVVAAGFLVVPCARSFLPGRGIRANVRSIGLAAAVIVTMWGAMTEQLKAARECIEPWPEVPYVAGARFRSESSGVRSAIGTIRRLSRAPGETVLLLPSDPNVESWLDRPRPNLSSAIPFTDQYRDHYVEADLAELEAHPPKVIAIGPRLVWRRFARWFHRDAGVERLIDLVMDRLIATRYGLIREAPIGFSHKRDFLDIYVRKD